MAKHDQRILKFLTQNAERAPTITDMMTRLNISISDITASLNSLLAQGMIAKRTNGQGIECWFPMNGSAPQPVPEYAQESRGSDARFISGLNNPAPPEPSPLPPLQPTLPSLSASSAFPVSLTSPAAPTTNPRTAAMESAVFAASPAARAAAAAAEAAPSYPNSPSQSPAPVIETLPGVPPMVPGSGYALAQPSRSGVGFITFLFGLIAVGAASIWLSGRLIKQDLEKSSRNYVEKSAMDAAVNSWTDFENTTKTHVKALEAQMRDLTAQLAAMKASNDSLQALAAKDEAGRKTEPVAKKPATRRRR